MDFDPKLLRDCLAHLGIDFSHAELYALGPACALRNVTTGDIVTREGLPTGGAILVLEGNYAVQARLGSRENTAETSRQVRGTSRGVSREDTVLVRLGAGALLGEVSFFDGGPATATVVAETPGKILILDQGAFATIEDKHPALATRVLEAFSRTLARRLRSATERLEHERDKHQKPDAAPPGLFVDIFRSLFGMGLS